MGLSNNNKSAATPRPAPPLAKGGIGTLVLLALVVAGWWFAENRRDHEASLVQFSGSTMGTTYTVKARQVPNGVTATDLQTEVDRILVDVNQQMSTYDESSELSRFNKSQSMEWVVVSEDLAQVVRRALEISRLTDGAFDVTVGPLVNLWGFGPDLSEDQIPSNAMVQAALARVGYQQLHARLNPPALKKDRVDLYVDLSAIAKGFGVDEIVQHLESQGINHYLVEIGGELRGKGLNPQNVPWRIAIEEPNPGKRAVQQVVKIVDRGIATSGDYRNFFEMDGQRYSHAMDPRTGQPVHHQLASVTVVNESAMDADAWATALLVLGPERGAKMADQQNLAAFFIVIQDRGLQENPSPRFAQYLLD
jgi:thiamine biosynthesis lipoprotein